MPVAPNVAKKPSGANLSDVAFAARLLIKYGAIALVFLMVGRVVLNFSTDLYRRLNPPKPPGPTYGFGTLPEIEFPISSITPATYKLELRSGALPTLDNQLPVYFMPKPQVSLLSLDESKQVASALGFVFAPEETSETEFRWRRSSPLPATLDMDIVSKKFEMRVDWASEPTFLSQKTLPQQTTAILNAREILQESGLVSADIATSEARVTFLRAFGNGFTPAVSFSEADFIRVDIFRTPIRQRYQILGPDPSKGAARFVFSGRPDDGTRIVEASYTHFPIEYERFETYGLLTTAQAWQILQQGGGYVARLDEGIADVTVRNVFLAYYDPDIPQSYLQPVYVFTGDKNFAAYVPAVLNPSQSSNR